MPVSAAVLLTPAGKGEVPNARAWRCQPICVIVARTLPLRGKVILDSLHISVRRFANPPKRGSVNSPAVRGLSIVPRRVSGVPRSASVDLNLLKRIFVASLPPQEIAEELWNIVEEVFGFAPKHVRELCMKEYFQDVESLLLRRANKLLTEIKRSGPVSLSLRESMDGLTPSIDESVREKHPQTFFSRFFRFFKPKRSPSQVPSGRTISTLGIVEWISLPVFTEWLSEFLFILWYSCIPVKLSQASEHDDIPIPHIRSICRQIVWKAIAGNTKKNSSRNAYGPVRRPLMQLLPWRIRLRLGDEGPLGETNWKDLQYDIVDRKRLVCVAQGRPSSEALIRMHWLTREFNDASVEKALQVDLAKRLLKSPFWPFCLTLVLATGWIVAQYGILSPYYASLTLVRLFLVDPVTWLIPAALIQLVFHTVVFSDSQAYVENFFLIEFCSGVVLATISSAWLYTAREVFDFVAWSLNEGYTMAFVLIGISSLYYIRFLYLLYLCIWTVVITLIFRSSIPDADDAIDTGNFPLQQWLAIAATLIVVLAGRYLFETHSRFDFLLCRTLYSESQRSDKLLRSILPDQVIQHLKNFDFEPSTSQRRRSSHLAATPAGIAEAYDKVTILFTDVSNFTTFSAHIAPEQLVLFLNELFTCFDDIAEECGLEKIKTIGDAYMCVCGLPNPNPNHAVAAARMGLRIVALMKSGQFRDHNGEFLGCRVGIHSGSVVAGVIGRKKFIYDIWGDAVNTASRMESTGDVNMVHCSEATASLINQQSDGAFIIQPRGEIEVKGKGTMRTCWILEEISKEDVGQGTLPGLTESDQLEHVNTYE